jgi:hypothetical protein
MGLIRILLATLGAFVAFLVTLPILLVGLPFWVVSGLARVLGSWIRRARPPSVPWSDLIEFIPEIGWRNRAGVQATVRAERAFRVTMDSEGWRGTGSIDEADMVVFGDSFAFGHGVDDKDFFADRSSGLRLKALGANGYNMVQELLWMERLQDRLAGKVVVWFAFYGNDLMDNLCTNFQHYPTPFLRKPRAGEGWEIVTEHVSPDPWSFDPQWGYRDKIAEICTPGRHSDRAFSACDFLIERGRQVCLAAGARLVVVGIPDVKMLDPAERKWLRSRSSSPESFDPTLPDQKMGEICHERGVPFLPLSDVVSVDDHLPNDCHWTAAGHGKVARVLERMAPGWTRSAPISASSDGLPDGPAGSPRAGPPDGPLASGEDSDWTASRAQSPKSLPTISSHDQP